MKYEQLDGNYRQLSIYDFLDESQEVTPSELFPQVDEAQEPKLHKCKCVGVSPSSDLDTIKGSVVEKDVSTMIESIMLPVQSPEVTDSTLISEDEMKYVQFTQEIAAKEYVDSLTPKYETNQIVTVEIPSDIKFPTQSPYADDNVMYCVENFYYVRNWREKQVRVLSSKAHPRKGFCYEVECVRTGKSGYFYEDELK